MKRQRVKPIDLHKVKRYSIRQRYSKVKLRDLARLPEPSRALAEFFKTFPQALKANDFRQVVADVVEASQKEKGVIWMMGAHLIKCGLSPLIIDLLRRKIITLIAMNGAAAIHDFELAFFGFTSEDVSASLGDGSFGMAEETGKWFNEIINEGVRRGEGLGEALGRSIMRRASNPELSILAQGYNYGVPVTVHVALGSDITHQHPEVDGAAIGKATMLDFRILAGSLPSLNKGGVVFNCGSAVILPEVFLKALNVARNVGSQIKDFTAVNIDMIQHYRPQVNVLERPTATGGRAYSFTCHFELFLPLLYAGILTELSASESR
ncbi:MAG: hypothetical protein N2246_00310 [Candidatus Sumerlaeia bacterium]|nr:hypothetical protein [Candidatus Sumerlaeia bacterium]